MKTSPDTLPDPVMRIDLQLFDTARRRAERLREAAIDEAVGGVARAPGALLRMLRSKLLRILTQRAAKEAAACRS